MELFEAIKAYDGVVALPIIIKSDMTRRGVKYSGRAVEQVRKIGDIRVKSCSLFSGDFVRPAVASQSIPAHIFIADGTEDGMALWSRLSNNTPYLIDYIDGQFGVYYNHEKLVDVHHFSKRGRFATRVFDDGNPYEEYVHASGDCSLFITAIKYCEYFSRGKQCLFCDIVPHAAARKKGGEITVLRQQADRTAEVLDAALREKQFRHLTISGGTFFSPYLGKTQVEWYSQFLNTLRQRIYIWPMSCMQIGALDDEGWKRIHDTGIPSIEPNIEVWDKRLFEIICSGKAETVGYDEWIKRTINAVKYWGRGNVNPNFVPGVEMAQPFGFEKVTDAVKSTAAGYNLFMSNDVLPRQGNFWWAGANSKLAGHPPPPLEYYLEIGIAYLEAREKHGFSNCPAAYCRSCMCQSTEHDFAYFHGHTAAS